MYNNQIQDEDSKGMTWVCKSIRLLRSSFWPMLWLDLLLAACNKHPLYSRVLKTSCHASQKSFWHHIAKTLVKRLFCSCPVVSEGHMLKFSEFVVLVCIRKMTIRFRVWGPYLQEIPTNKRNGHGILLENLQRYKNPKEASY